MVRQRLLEGGARRVLPRRRTALERHPAIPTPPDGISVATIFPLMTRFPDFMGPSGPTDDPGTEAGDATGLPVEPESSAIRRLEDELAELQDRHVRLAAEFDNYRKRSLRERNELGERAQAALVAKLVDALDDLHRAVSSDPATTPVDALRVAINAVDQKVWKELQAAGLERIDPVGAPFDPTTQEAVGIVPTRLT